MNYLWLVLLMLHSALSQTTDKYSDEDRPYKFGFNIQGYQHRQEEKDERGLIKGEYGFITADGYYRVTVYATDENGDFKILSMKNYYVGFPPEDPTTTPGTTSDRAARPRQQQLNPSVDRAPVARGRALGVDDVTTKAPKAFTRPQGVAACSDCSIPTTTPKGNPANLLVDTGEFRSGRTRDGNFAPVIGQGPGRQSPQASPRGRVQTPEGKLSGFSQGPNTQGPAGGQAPQFGGRAPLTNTQFSGGIGNDARGSFEGGNPQRPGGSPAFKQAGGTPRFKPAGGSAGFEPTRGSFGSRDSGSPGSPRGRTDFTQNNQLDGTPQRRPQVGEVREGLPPGVTLNDIKDLLYTFNYTVGFHGHHEDGYRNGDKQGDYFFDGRDGVERKVEYLANEFGFQPNITLIDLADNDVRKPKEETEKEYGLKGYEFKWFYRK